MNDADECDVDDDLIEASGEEDADDASIGDEDDGLSDTEADEDVDSVEPDPFEEEFGDGVDTIDDRIKREKETLRAERKVRRENNKTTYYVNPDLLLQRIKDYYATDKMTPELAGDIRKITERLCFMPKFINYTFRDEMAADAFSKAYMVIFLKKFNVNLGFTPFNYISKVAERACVHRIMTERAEHQKIYAYRDDHYDQIRQDNTGGDD